MNEFKNYHPLVNLIYFVVVIAFSCFLMNPICLAISLVSGFTYSVILKGRKAFKTNLLYMLPMIILVAVINPAFNHQGVTILGYLPGGNPLTLESIIYGIASAVMIADVICWFSCYNEVMTSDKFIYLFGRIIPSLSLIISMTLRFVPKFIKQLKAVANAQKGIGRDASDGTIIKRVKNALSILSVMATWALENSIETADSMKSRGYGLPGRTAFSIFKFQKRDKLILFMIIMSGIYIFSGNMLKAINFSYFPGIKGTGPSFFGISIYIVYFLLCMCPVIIEAMEVRKWKSIKSKT